MGAIRVVLADDHAVVRRGVRALLQEAPDIEVVAEAADGHQALASVEAKRPDVLVTDIAMPGLTGLELAKRVARDFPQTRVLILSMHKEKEYATRALAAGAGGYLLKDAGDAECEAAVRAVARGESYLSPSVSGHVVTEYVRLAKDKNSHFKLMGFGHRVYKNFDPRAKIIKAAADKVLNKLGRPDPLLDIAKALEEAALKDSYFVERKLYPNVDFYSGIIYRAMGFPTNMFTVLFALGRLPGWIAHWKEMMEDPTTKIARPRQIYTGPTVRDYVPMEKRS